MRDIVLINASPKINDKSASEYLIKAAGSHIEESTAKKIFINIRQSISKKRTQEDFEILSQADAVIIAFPLYVFCLPGLLIRFLQDFHQYCITHDITVRSPKVYAIVNCGFPEPEINLEAVRVIKSFCQQVNARFRFGVLIGGGPMVVGPTDAPFMKKTIRKINDAFSTIASDIADIDLKEMSNINIAMNFPRRFYLFMADRGWVSWARKNRLQKKDLYRKPYRENNIE